MTNISQEPAETTVQQTLFSSVIILASVHVYFWIGNAYALFDQGVMARDQLISIGIWLAVLACWGLLIARLSVAGALASPRFLRTRPGLWFPTMAVNITILVLALLEPLRTAIWQMAMHVSDVNFVLLQTLRVFAVATVIKAARGQIPKSIGYVVGIPDTLFGLSAVALVAFGAVDNLSPMLLIQWNALGIIIMLILPPILQAALPGGYGRFDASHRTRTLGEALFEYPLVMAPAVLATLFIMTSLVHIVGLALR